MSANLVTCQLISHNASYDWVEPSLAGASVSHVITNRNSSRDRSGEGPVGGRELEKGFERNE